MVRLREIPRTGVFAWAPGSQLLLLVTGTRAGAVNADFSDETKLELWDLGLDKPEQGLELQPIASISVDSRFHGIAWGGITKDHPQGIIAGALENGALDLWDAEKLISGAEDALISRNTKHTGPIKAIEFNPIVPGILATAGPKGELYIWNTNTSESYRLIAQNAAQDNDCLAWNRKVATILAVGGTGGAGNSGFVAVWNTKTKETSCTVGIPRKPVSTIAWDPLNATKLLTGTPDDSTPVIQLWNLRNTNAPERTLEGHFQGILSLSWCQLDPELLLSSGKDNRTICWNPATGEQYGEFPEATNWTFQTSFNPHNPSISATASFDGKILIQTLQNTSSPAGQAQEQEAMDGEDFFAKARTQPQGASFSLKKAPKWLERPVGASFGFGGKLVSFSLQETQAGQPRSSRIEISQTTIDSDIGTEADSFEALLKAGEIGSICQTHIAQAKSDDEKADWKVIETLIGDNPRKGVTEYLGFAEEAGVTTNGVSEKDGEEAAKKEESDTQENKEPAKTDADFFGDGGDEDADDFSKLGIGQAAANNPFHLYTETDSESDKMITRALLLGQFEKAMTACLAADRMADAFVIANCGGKDLLDKAQAAYLAKKNQGPNYIRLLTSVIGKNLRDIVYNADLTDWKDVMATLCTFADPTEFPELCESLGDRILETGLRKDASFCYLVGSKLEKVVGIWVEELKEGEASGIQEGTEHSTFSVHAKALQNFIEKVTVFREVVKFQDKELDLKSDWALTALYNKYTEYADVVAAQGNLATAEKYLNLLPTEYPAAQAARDRVKLASRKAGAQSQTYQQPATTTRSAPRVAPAQLGYQPPQQSFAPPTPAANPYQPPAPAPASAPGASQYTPTNTYAPAANAYAPSNNSYAPPANSYAPSSGYQPPQQQGGYGPPPMRGPPMGGPPRNGGSTIVPAALRKDITPWNDTPMVTKPATSRRSTPSAPPPSTYGNQNMQPPAPLYGGPRATPTPPPPPPKGSAPPRMSSPLTNPPPRTFSQSEVPPSPATNPYAPPPPPSNQQYAPPTVPRGASPYNAPPSGPPPSNRYAPSPAPANPGYGQAQPGSMPPPPQGVMRGPPSNQYAQFAPSGGFSSQPPPQNQYAPAQSPYQPQGAPSQVQPQGQPQGPPQGPLQGPFQASRSPTAPSQAALPAQSSTKQRLPPGDRSQIPANAQQMVEIFTSEMQRVATKAPASFHAQVKDAQKRLNLLFDHLNNSELVKPDTIQKLSELAQALQAKQFDVAAKMQVDIQKEKTEECGNWMVGVKRLVSMSKVTP